MREVSRGHSKSGHEPLKKTEGSQKNERLNVRMELNTKEFIEAKKKGKQKRIRELLVRGQDGIRK